MLPSSYKEMNLLFTVLLSKFISPSNYCYKLWNSSALQKFASLEVLLNTPNGERIINNKRDKDYRLQLPKLGLKMSLPINKKAAPAFVTVFENKYKKINKFSFPFMDNKFKSLKPKK